MTLEARPAFMNKPSSDNSRHQTSIEFRLTPMLLIAALALPANAQLVIKLSSQTVSEFDHYASSVESQKEERWHGRKNFLYVEDDAANKARVLNGEVFIKQMNDGRPVSITDGLIHDWSGAIFIPNTTVERVVSALEDFDNHKKFYPAVTESKTVRHQGNEVTGYWRLQQKGLVPVILDVEDSVRYEKLSPGKWKGEAFARDIREVDTGLFSRGRKFPAGEGHGYLWGLNGYWTLESVNGGVLAECRSLSLSRDIPQGLAWAVAPYVQKMPQESLASTLKVTREAVAARP